jgi:drug/metabolite transporter (DMT)-like permease
MTCYGGGSVLQALAARRTVMAQRLDARFLIRLASQIPYLAGLALDLLGFAFNVVALQSLPLFLVQCMIAGSVGVTAIIAVPVLHVRLGRKGVVALLVLIVGLILLATSAEPGPARSLTPVQQWLLLASAVILGLASTPAFRLSDRRAFLVVSGLAGLAFAGVGVSARSMQLTDPLWHTIYSPLLWAMAAFGLLGMLLFASALQRGSVTVASGVMFTVEIAVASAVGFALLGDAVPPGVNLAIATVGVALSLGGAMRLAQYGEPPVG